MTSLTILAAAGALAAGLLVGWLLARARGAAERVRLETALDAERQRARDQEALVAAADARLRETFAALSSDALQANNQQFLDLATAHLGRFQEQAAGGLEAREQAIQALVKPLEESLKRVDERIGVVEKDRLSSYAALTAHVEEMGRSQQQLRLETQNLVKALRTPHVRGAWGEIQLRRVVEMAGMVEHCDFSEQASTTTDDGGRLRPDLIVRLPGGKRIVVDSKAPLSAYLEAAEAPDEAQRDALLVQHARQVRTHIDQLAGKSYWSQFPDAPDFVVMFLPGESFFSAACQVDPGLIDHAVDRSVIPASPTTLITLLRTVQFGWRQERVAESAEQVRKLGQELYDRLRVLAGHLQRVGNGLTSASSAYNEAVGSFEGRALVSARKFTELGAGQGKDIPELGPVETGVRQLDRES